MDANEIIKGLEQNKLEAEGQITFFSIAGHSIREEGKDVTHEYIAWQKRQVDELNAQIYRWARYKVDTGN